MFSGLQWTLSAEPLAQQLSIPVIKDLLTSDEYLMSECSGVWLRRSLVMSSQVIETVAQSTVGQRSNPLWNIVRKHRITASNFGPVLQAIRRSRYRLLKYLVSLQPVEASVNNFTTITC